MPGYKSDHSFVELIIAMDNQVKGKGLWKFNTMHLEDPEFTFKIKNVIEKAQTKYVSCDPSMKWELTKCDISQAAVDYA